MDRIGSFLHHMLSDRYTGISFKEIESYRYWDACDFYSDRIGSR